MPSAIQFIEALAKALEYRIRYLDIYSILHYEKCPLLPPFASAFLSEPEINFEKELKQIKKELRELYQTSPEAADYSWCEAHLLLCEAR